MRVVDKPNPPPEPTIICHVQQNMKIAPQTSAEEIRAFFSIMRTLRPQLGPSEFEAAVERMKKEGYRLVALFDPEIRAAAGFRKIEMLATGPILYVDDLVTLPDFRSRGYGQALLGWLIDLAKNEECQFLELDSGEERLDAHRFYQRAGLEKVAVHFSIPALAGQKWKATS